MVLVVNMKTNKFSTKLTFKNSVIRLRNPVMRCIFPLFTVTYPQMPSITKAAIVTTPRRDKKPLSGI